MDYIVPLCIFFSCFVFVWIFFDCVLHMRMKRRMQEAWKFINGMDVIIKAPVEEVPARVPF